MHDEEFEDFLRRFEPVPPRPLPRRRARLVHGIAWTSLAATVALALGGLLLTGRPLPAPATRSLPPGKVRGAASERTLLQLDDDTLERALDAEARKTLPDPTPAGHALQSLASFTDDL